MARDDVTVSLLLETREEGIEAFSAVLEAMTKLTRTTGLQSTEAQKLTRVFMEELARTRDLSKALAQVRTELAQHVTINEQVNMLLIQLHNELRSISDEFDDFTGVVRNFVVANRELSYEQLALLKILHELHKPIKGLVDILGEYAGSLTQVYTLGGMVRVSIREFYETAIEYTTKYAVSLGLINKSIYSLQSMILDLRQAVGATEEEVTGLMEGLSKTGGIAIYARNQLVQLGSALIVQASALGLNVRQWSEFVDKVVLFNLKGRTSIETVTKLAEALATVPGELSSIVSVLADLVPYLSMMGFHIEDVAGKLGMFLSVVQRVGGETRVVADIIKGLALEYSPEWAKSMSLLARVAGVLQVPIETLQSALLGNEEALLKVAEAAERNRERLGPMSRALGELKDTVLGWAMAGREGVKQMIQQHKEAEKSAALNKRLQETLSSLRRVAIEFFMSMLRAFQPILQVMTAFLQFAAKIPGVIKMIGVMAGTIVILKGIIFFINALKQIPMYLRIIIEEFRRLSGVLTSINAQMVMFNQQMRQATVQRAAAAVMPAGVPMGPIPGGPVPGGPVPRGPVPRGGFGGLRGFGALGAIALAGTALEAIGQSSQSPFLQTLGAVGSGAATGASWGMIAGSIIPGLGTALGGAIGAVVGGTIGLISSITQRQEQERQNALLVKQQALEQERARFSVQRSMLGASPARYFPNPW